MQVASRRAHFYFWNTLRVSVLQYTDSARASVKGYSRLLLNGTSQKNALSTWDENGYHTYKICYKLSLRENSLLVVYVCTKNSTVMPTVRDTLGVLRLIFGLRSSSIPYHKAVYDMECSLDCHKLSCWAHELL